MARSFNGSTDRIDWANNWDSQGQALSICAWVYLVDTTTNMYLFHHGSDNSTTGWLLSHKGDIATGVMQFWKNGSTALRRQTASGTIPTGQWTHLIATHDGTFTDASTVGMYVDGSEATYNDPQNGVSENSFVADNWSVGGRDYDDNRNWGGYVAEVAIWNRVISADEIKALSKGNSPLLFPGSIKFYVSLMRDTEDMINGVSATLDGTAVIEHPRIIYPASPIY